VHALVLRCASGKRALASRWLRLLCPPTRAWVGRGNVAHGRGSALTPLWPAGDAAANDTVGGRGERKGPSGVTKAMLARYDGMGKQEKKSKLAALK
jgi:hypothetical protein